PEFFDVRSWPMASGSPITQGDVDAGAKVIVLGKTVVEQLFGPSADPVGQVVRAGQVPFNVIGVAAPKGQSPQGQDYDDTVLLHCTTFAAKIQGGLGKDVQGTIYVAGIDTTRAETSIQSLLRERHPLSRNEDDDFSIRNLAEIASAREEGTNTMKT